MTPRQRVDGLAGIVISSMQELRELKKEHSELRVAVKADVGSILNGYREGDITFDEAIELINSLRQ